MTLRQLPKAAVADALALAGRAYDRCIKLLEADPRDEFTTTDSPAVLLRENLEPKHRIARQRGKVIHGDDELLIALADLGAEPVCGVFLDHDREHIAIYLRTSSLAPVGCVVVEDPEPG